MTAIEAVGLTKRHGDVTAVDQVSFAVRPGAITGFVGPNGAGKSTTLRLLMGLDQPTAGATYVDGRPIGEWPEPGRKVGAALSSQCNHPGRTARDSVRWVTQLVGASESRCDEVLEEVGLGAVSTRRTRGFSLGMRQRLAIAIALVPEPEILVLDEPMNGLDPEGITWVKKLLGRFRDDGRTVFLATHLLSEVEDLVDDLVVITQGRVIESGSAAEFIDRHHQGAVVVRSDDLQGLADVIRANGGEIVRVHDDGRMEVAGLDGERVGRLASSASISISELSTQRSLHGAFDSATRESAVIGGGAGIHTDREIR